MKQSKIWTKEEIKTLLGSNSDVSLEKDYWKVKAMLRLYWLQSNKEKQKYNSIYKNFIGLDRTDSKNLDIPIKTVLAGKRLSEKQLAYIRNKIPHYFEQLTRISNSLPLIKNVENAMEMWYEKHKDLGIYSQTKIEF